MKMIKTIIVGWVLVTLVGVELKADWIVVHEVSLEDCVKSGGINEHDITFDVMVCNIQDRNLNKLLIKKD